MLLDHFFTILLVCLKYLDKSAELFFCLFVFLLLIELVSDVVGLDSLSIEDPLPFLSYILGHQCNYEKTRTVLKIYAN